MHISGFINIEDHLHQDKYHRDKDLQDATLDALAQEPAFRAICAYADRGPLPESGQWISVNTQACVVRLDSQVSSLSHWRLAEVICWWMTGSCDVHNYICKHTAGQGNDDEISAAVRLVLEKDPLRHAETVSAKTPGAGGDPWKVTCTILNRDAGQYMAVGICRGCTMSKTACD